MQDYKKMNIWAKAHKLTVNVYRITADFPRNELYGLVSQLRRASASIPANIAEGCGRNTRSDFAHFLNISLGSVNETSYFLLLSRDLNYINDELYIHLEREIDSIKAMLISFILKVRNNKQV